MYKSKIEQFIPSIIQMYNEGKSCEFIASKIGCSRATVAYQLKNRGINLRNKKGIKHSINNRRLVSLETLKSKEGTPEFDYLLGILATDGNICKTNIRIEQSDENLEILEHCRSILNNSIEIKKSIHHGNKYNIISFKNGDICNYLSTFGITPKKSFTLKLTYINWNVLRGIFDGDGCLTYDKRKNGSWRLRITSASIDFINQIADFLLDNGISPLIYKEKSYYNLHIGKLSELYYIYQHFYKDSSCFLKRKRDKFCPLVEKYTRENSVNSVKEMENY